MFEDMVPRDSVKPLLSVHVSVNEQVHLKASTVASIEEWLTDLDPDMISYAPYFRNQGFTLSNAVKFLKEKDLATMDISILLGHRMLTANAVCKLQTPNSKVTFL